MKIEPVWNKWTLVFLDEGLVSIQSVVKAEKERIKKIKNENTDTNDVKKSD